MELALEVTVEKQGIAEASGTAKKETTLYCIRCLIPKLNIIVQEAMDILYVHANKRKEYIAPV